MSSPYRKQRRAKRQPYTEPRAGRDDDWNVPCKCCGEVPTVHFSGLCKTCYLMDAAPSDGELEIAEMKS